MRKIRLVALDLDGTTLNSEGHIPLNVRDTLEEAIFRGINVIVATGRVFSAITEEVLSLKGLRYVLSSNGALVTDVIDNKMVYENFIDPDAVLDISKTLRQYDFMYEVFTGGKAYVDRIYFDNIIANKMKISERHTSYIIRTRNPVLDVLSFMVDNKDAIENININFTDMEDRIMMRNLLGKKTNITLTNSFDHNLEIGGLTTGKGDAVEKVAGILKIKKNEIMAVGDNPNDKSMLMASGLPVAVANAKDDVKAIAKYITSSNDEGGVAEAIRKFAF
ncbi:MAG: Cof-type HAD-IIB family hydrolase [Anaerovoracaceae bacterium]|nr:HAD family hydrolase [Clostridiales bacterium]